MNVPALPFPHRLWHYESIDSTNLEALRRAEQGAADKSVFVAKQQEAGRGRRGRAWVSPVGNLYASVLRRNLPPALHLTGWTFLWSLAIAQSLLSLKPDLPITLKWPNDVLLGGAKVSGLLLEGEGQALLVAGFGVNCHSAPEGTEYPATTLAAHGLLLEPLSLLAHIVHSADALEQGWLTQGFGFIRHSWLLLAQGMGQPIRVRMAQEELSGIFAGLDDHGQLQLQRGEQMQLISAGDIFFGAS